MKNKLFLKLLAIILMAIVGSSSSFAGGGTTTYYGKVTATATGGGKVYVSKSQTPPTASQWSAVNGTSSAENEANISYDSTFSRPNSADMDFFLYASDDVEGEIQWYDGNNLCGEGNGCKYTLTAKSTTQSSPTTASVELRYKVITYPYAETVNGVTYVFADNKIKYTLNSDGSATVADQEHRATLVGALTIPATITNPDNNQTYNVNKIVAGAFLGCVNITAITFEAPIASIEGKISVNAQSYCDGAPSLSVTGGGLFAGCTSLNSVDMSACRFTNTKGTGNYGGTFFACTNITSVKFPDTLEELSGAEFIGCKVLSTVDLRNATNLTKIGEYSFGMKNGGTANSEYFDGNGYYNSSLKNYS